MDELRTERLRWRLPRESDFDGYLALVSDYEVVKLTATWPHPPDPDLVRRRCEPVPAESGFAGPVFLARALIGVIGIIDAELGFMFARRHWGRGYATEMAAAMIARAFQRHDWAQISADVFAGNPASERVLDKLGFQKTGRGEHSCAAQGRSLPLAHFALTREAWLAANPLRIETARLVIRPLSDADAPALHRFASRREVADMMQSLPHPMTPKQAQDWISARRWQGRLGFCPGVWLKGGPLIGALGIGGDPVSTAYFFDPDHWGRGYATEAMAAFLGWAFDHFDLSDLVAGANETNLASQRVLAKLGFERTGRELHQSPHRLEPDRLILYRLTRTRFEART